MGSIPHRLTVSPSHLSHSRRGLSLIEMAVVLLLLLWLVFGIMEYGWMLLKSQQVHGAVRQGARIGSTIDAEAQHVEQAVTNAMAQHGLAGSYQLVINPAAIHELDAGEMFEVEITLNYAQGDNPVSLNLPVPKPPALRARLTMVKEGT